MLTAYFKNELGKKGYQFVDDKTQAAYTIMGREIYFTKMSVASQQGRPRFSDPIGPLVEKSGGIDKIEVDSFPDGSSS